MRAHGQQKRACGPPASFFWFFRGGGRGCRCDGGVWGGQKVFPSRRVARGLCAPSEGRRTDRGCVREAATQVKERGEGGGGGGAGGLGMGVWVAILRKGAFLPLRSVPRAGGTAARPRGFFFFRGRQSTDSGRRRGGRTREVSPRPASAGVGLEGRWWLRGKKKGNSAERRKGNGGWLSGGGAKSDRGAGGPLEAAATNA